MYTEDDTMTPRDRISDDMLQRMLNGNGMASGDMTARPHDTAPKGNAPDRATLPRHTTWGLEGYPLASVYAPLQEFRNLYDTDTALNKGTLFTELYLPFMGESVADQGGCYRA